MWDYGEGNRGPQLAAVSIVMAAVSVVAVAMRSYTMAKILKRFLIEDYLAVFTCLLQCGFCIVVVQGVSYGLGAHVESVPEVNRHKALIFKWAGQVAYIVVSTIVKFVVGIFILRLCVNNNWQRITIIVLLCIVGLFNAFYVFMAIFQCQPVEYYWYRYAKDAPVTGKCNGHTLATIPTYFAVLIGLVSDLTLALLPATLIKGANLDRKTKVSVCCVLALGSLASVATIARVPYASQLLSNPDYLYNFTDLAIWSIVECGIAITASSLATLRPLFIQMKILANSHFTSRYGHSFASGGLPIQSANSVTIISSSGRSKNRNTGLTGSTVFSGTLSQTGGSPAKSLKQGSEGVQVEKEFEMLVVTKESSTDSFDKLGAEANEFMTPGRRVAKHKSSYDQMSQSARSDSSSSRRRPPPLQPTFQSPPSSAENTGSTGSAISGHRYDAEASFPYPPSSPQMGRRPSEGVITHKTSFTDTMSSPRHQYSQSETGSLRSGRVTFSPPSFHLPSRLHHQSTASDQYNSTRYESRGTFQGLSAPPRIAHNGPGGFAPNNVVTPPPGSPISVSASRSGRSLPGSPDTHTGGQGSPSRFPFPRQGTIQEIQEEGAEPARRTRGKQRVSACLATPSESPAASSNEEEGFQQEELESPLWARPSPNLYSIPSPLRSNPPRGTDNWV